MATKRQVWVALMLASGLAAPRAALSLELRRSAFVGAGRAADRTMDAITVVGDPVSAVSRTGAIDLWHGFLGPLGLMSGSGIEAAPEGIGIEPITPNPASSKVAIRFRVDGDRPVTVSVYDLRGRRVRRFDVPVLAGEGAIRWNCDADGGAPLPSGLYFVRLEADHQCAARPVMLVD